MIEKIKELEKISSILNPSFEERDRLLKKIIDYSSDFINKTPSDPAYYFPQGDQIPYNSNFNIEDKIDIDEALLEFKNKIEKSGINGASGLHLGYIPGSTLYHSALADFLSALTNRYASVYFASPGAVKLENSIIQWMASLIGYNKEAKGVLTSGGSLANLTAIITAREAFNLKSKDFSKVVVYFTSQAHHSIEKALRIAGMNECVKHYVCMDINFRMRTDCLQKAIDRDKLIGLIPWLVVSAAGATDTGSVDPLNDIAEIAMKNKIWNHVDGAYGAFFILTEKGKKLFNGIDKSDSIVIDPHKGLFIPFGTGALIVKNGIKLFNANSYNASYMQDALNNNLELSPADLSPELSRHFRGLRIWLPLKLNGIFPFSAALQEKLLLAEYAFEELNKIPGIVLGPKPDLSILSFRYVPQYGNADEYNKNLLEEIHKDGRVFLSSTILNGNFTLRMAILSYKTHLKEINLAIDVIKEKVLMLNKM